LEVSRRVGLLGTEPSGSPGLFPIYSSDNFFRQGGRLEPQALPRR
jgi:hypothetical protein